MGRNSIFPGRNSFPPAQGVEDKVNTELALGCHGEARWRSQVKASGGPPVNRVGGNRQRAFLHQADFGEVLQRAAPLSC